MLTKFFRKAVTFIAVLAGAFLVLSAGSVFLLKHINPPTTSFMLQRTAEVILNSEEQVDIRYEWVDWDQISPYIKVAVVTSEDQNFASHRGFDLESIRDAIREYQRGEGLRGASTISQQTAKNLFLWPGQSLFRKVVEAYFTILIEWMWTKKRILEIYLNIAEFGNGIYGVKAASDQFFGIEPSELTMLQSALMATALPSPRRYDVGRPSPYMIRQRNWIIEYMFYLGNTEYLEKLE